MDTKIDINRVVASALEAALHEEPARRRRVPGVRTVATGAALVTAARVAQKHLPRLSELRLVGHGLEKLEDIPNFRDVTASVRDRLTGHGHEHDEDEESDDQGPEDFDDPDEDDDFDEDQDEDDDDEDDDEEDEEDEDDDEEDEDDDEHDEDDDEHDDDEDPADKAADRGSSDGSPDLVEALSTSRPRPPVIETLANAVDPAARPPSRKGKSKTARS